MRVTPPCLPRLYPRLYSQVFPCSNSTAAAAQQHIIKKTQSQTRQRNERCTLRNPNCGTPATRRPRVRLASEPESPPQNRLDWNQLDWNPSIQESEDVAASDVSAPVFSPAALSASCSVSSPAAASVSPSASEVGHRPAS